MGAPARIWCSRALTLALIVAAASVLAFLPLAPLVKLALYGAAAAVGYRLAFHRLAGFDLRGRINWRLAPRLRKEKTCALTFDDGPCEGTARVLDVLGEAGVKATFFVLANNANRHPDVLRRAQAEGHTIAIHGTTHAKLHKADEVEVDQEVSSATYALQALGVEIAPLYRTPHGLKNSAVFRVAKKRGLQLWAWSRGVWDTDAPAPQVLVKRATRMARPGMVLLLHDGRGDEPEPNIASMLSALPQIIQSLKDAGFRFVTL